MNRNARLSQQMSLEEEIKRLREGHMLEWICYTRQKTNQRTMSYGRGSQGVPFSKVIREDLMREVAASLRNSIAGQG